ncbi:MAG: phosphoribosylanthranilate isomerase [Spirochaetales bacterium]|nr:phosphoribosylanthranilate isomerase [Spirochaetales bacterium]
MSQQRPKRLGKAFSPRFVRIKICGLTRLEDARLALRSGADYLGFIFAASPRRLTPGSAAAILNSLQSEQSGRPFSTQRVGVFVNQSAAFIEETARTAGLTMLQLHGDEDPGFCSRFALPVIKALRMRDRSVLDRIGLYDTPYILLEPFLEGKYGGTGVQANWKLAAEIVRSFPAKRFFLAGGLGAHNIAAAVAAVRPFAVDSSSALESGPGLKDRQKVEAFFEAVRNR